MGTLADLYTTSLSPQREAEYQQWRARLPGDLQNDGDYDLRGAFQAQAQANGRLHMTDQFKKPNHMTFSDGSQYSTPQQPGGSWIDDGRGGYVFWASPTNLQHHTLSDLAQYFNEAEKGSSFVAPINYNMPGRR